MKNPSLVPAILAMLALVCSVSGSRAAAQKAAAQSPSPTKWQLVWSDEFNAPDGSAPDPAKWAYELGGGGFGNNELESYTDRPANIRIEHGKLVITARKEPYTGKDGIAREYTSARIRTLGLFSQKYGRFEARIKLPAGGQGVWPAFWMLGDDIGKVGWPDCGEIDIMENIGKEPFKVHGTIHGPGYSGEHGLTATYTLPGNKAFSKGYHLFSVEWEPKAIRFYVDNILYETQTPADLPAGAHWVYDHPFFLLLNVAVGGYWPGNPDQATRFPTSMLVDYVRVYQRAPAK